MKGISLRNRLLRYLIKQHGWVSSAQLQKIVLEHTSYMPRTAVRRLQELVEDGKLETKVIGKMSWFSAKPGIPILNLPPHNFIPGVGALKDYTGSGIELN